jgi:hypothetical protein
MLQEQLYQEAIKAAIEGKPILAADILRGTKKYTKAAVSMPREQLTTGDEIKALQSRIAAMADECDMLKREVENKSGIVELKVANITATTFFLSPHSCHLTPVTALLSPHSHPCRLIGCEGWL